MPFLARPYESNRRTAVLVIGAIIKNQCCGDEALQVKLVNALQQRSGDDSFRVRMLVTVGLGNVASFPKKQVNLMAASILAAIIGGMDDKEDKEDDMATKTMDALTKLLAVVDEQYATMLVSNLCIKIRPCFDHVSA